MERFKLAVLLKTETILANLNKYRRQSPLKVALKMEEQGRSLWLHFSGEEKSQSLCFEMPYRDEYGNYVIGDRVKRAVGTWHHQDTEYDYWSLLCWIMTGRIETAFPVSRRSQLERLLLSFDSEQTALHFRSLQDMVDGIVNKLPLTGTPMETWAMCNRVVFLDPTFDSLTPEKALEYQKEANKRFFPWTSIGLSDSGMCNNNLLKVDLRAYTPFGVKHHNPMRNLYQTLGMRGDEAPMIQTKSMAQLTANQGVARRGWNWTTCFLDVPYNFEDQLIVDQRHLDKFTSESKKLICFGEVEVSAGQEIEEGTTLSQEPNGKPLVYWGKADRTMVTDVQRDQITFNGQMRDVTVVYLETKHTFKEGIKLTNRHGNKGVVAFADCGTMLNETTGQEQPIDIIVSAKTIGKRRNFGQVLETLLGILRPGEKLILADDAEITVEQLKKALRKKGFAEDGTSPVKTQWYRGRALCGSCFWGLIKNPETQLWTKAEVEATDNRGRRIAGTKLSHIELKGLTTIFGADNAVVEEILSHQQGFEDVLELLLALEVLRGKTFDRPSLDWSKIKPVNQANGYFHNKNELAETIVDESLLPEGFFLKLPVSVHVFTPDDERKGIEYNLVLGDKTAATFNQEKGRNNVFDSIYVPSGAIRSSWQHPTGKWGLSDIGGFLNNVVLSCHQFSDGGEEALRKAVERYFTHISTRLSTKRGEIATFALAVRYPHSTKATATLAKEGLPENWVEIHRSMADDLQVSDGAYVIVERFPCLGFKSLRIQRVKVTDDPQCRYVIRVSGNSLVSQNLDFDGDVLFIMGFKTEAAQALLQQEFHNPDPQRKQYLEDANQAKQPFTGSASIDTIGFRSFEPLTAEKQAEIVGLLTGLKRSTGTIIALTYNVMRVIEGNIGFGDKETNLAMEVIMDQVANSVFSQKHAGESIEQRCKRAICTADLKEMLGMGFPERGSERLCAIVRAEAANVGVSDLEKHYRNHLKYGTSNVINKIVREKRRFYFATRSNLPPTRFLEHLEDPPIDLTSYLWERALTKQREHGLS